jgi:hypothetical protein
MNYVNLNHFQRILLQFNPIMSIITTSYKFKTNLNELCDFK